MKIDIFTHLVSRPFHEALSRHLGESYPAAQKNVGLTNLDARFRLMDLFGDYMQVLVPGGPPLEAVASPKKAVELATIANDGMAEVVSRHPDRFLAAAAVVPTNNIEFALDEIDRAVTQLDLKGIYLYTPQYIFSEKEVNDGAVEDKEKPKGHTVGKLPLATKALDAPELAPIFEKMAQLNLPIWLHPRTTPAFPDYTTEKRSQYRIWQIFGWPYQTTAAMIRLVFSGIFKQYPDIKIITHHGGAMIPIFENRMKVQYDYDEKLYGGELTKGWDRSPVDYLRLFYTDTALNGNVPALMCSYAFFGPERLLFGTDAPHDHQFGEISIRDTIASIEKMDIDSKEKQMIFEANVRQLLQMR